MNVASLRSSMSSYGDPRYLSAAYPSGAVTGIPSKVLVDGYRGTSDLSNDDRSQYSGSGMVPQPNTPSVDVTDSVLMHLLTETAIGDSAGYEILPFETVEDLKREYAILSSRIEGTKRKLALETKLRDAAQSLRRLPDPQAHLKSGYMNGGPNGIADESENDEFTVSAQKCETLAQELWTLEQRAQSVHKRLLEHTSGILQLTHRGLKKNINRNGANGTNGMAQPSTSEFDDRSLYRSLDNSDGQNGLGINSSALRSTEQKLEQLNGRLRDMLLQSQGDYGLEPLPQKSNEDETSPAFMQAHLAYLENHLDILQSGNLPTGGTGLAAGEMETELNAINGRLHTLLGQAGSHLSPTLPPPPSPSGEFVSTHMDYLRSGFDDLQSRIEGLQDQKSILTTQIQQQRELNSKSDAEKDAHVADITRELVETRKQFELSEREVQGVRDEMALIMEQLDAARQYQTLRDQSREQETTALETERNARQQAEQEITRLQDSLRKASEGQTKAETETHRLREELDQLEGEFARAQTELTVVKAELDGAYGTRAERAAEAAANPALRKELEDLNAKNISLTEELASLRAGQDNDQGGDSQKRVEMLEKELRDTIEDYEVMTKASVEFEKEREKYESHIDNLRDRCEQLESQLSDERITWMGISSQMTTRDAATETTSTMVLKNEFKKMMRDTRSENMKLLRAEQEERKKLEALVRSLKMENTMGKSNLSQSTVVSHA
ncbi:involucrin repeat protein [Talaromyces proteolyticus]|uniref:Involucrin repeat protein n=1 Tax=Talaromyces proteolyticus TaxID=1131652 RepID=A0AAD4KSY3_9EURO|nr:involucrin repeat protein [Talaromyces proteolyticus]KAH8697617.1 involucrin repeat protein [Talaromyces proteolyticus]